MGTLDYLAARFNLDLTQRSPIEILPINRAIMADVLCELGFTVGAEVGVARGEHAQILCQHNPRLRLYAVDAWRHYHGYNDYLTDKLDWFYKDAVLRLAPYNCTILRKFSLDAVLDFADGSLDFVYIDAAHDFQSVTNDIAEWSKKVRKDGIIFGHDFKRSSNPKLRQHVVDVVQGWTYANKIAPWFVLGTKGRRDGTPYREGTQAWMWVQS